MKKYRVLIRGENFLINLDGVNQKVGFYTTRFVEAGNEAAAEHAAMDVLRGDPELVKGVLNEKVDPPMMYAEEVEELESFEGLRVAGTGFAFYPDEGKG
jgi:CO dehydrogenase/acetyl-CoA synthase gamma subunit (corrinoid Fe-S protein)